MWLSLSFQHRMENNWKSLRKPDPKTKVEKKPIRSLAQRNEAERGPNCSFWATCSLRKSSVSGPIEQIKYLFGYWLEGWKVATGNSPIIGISQCLGLDEEVITDRNLHLSLEMDANCAHLGLTAFGCMRDSCHRVTTLPQTQQAMRAWTHSLCMQGKLCLSQLSYTPSCLL